ncbi:MAG: hypothetical protein GY699_10300 [Desulfobacteraceae bacterium]|nr:hypothetical protein [Desulfobacteraceae bacterium]
MMKIHPRIKCRMSFVLIFLCGVSIANSQIIIQSGEAPNATVITVGDINLFWSSANTHFGYLTTDFGTEFADVSPSTHYSGSYETHDGVRHIWDVRHATDYSFSTPAYGSLLYGNQTHDLNSSYRGIILFKQNGYYGAIQPLDIYEVEGVRTLSYTLWYDDTPGACDFSSLNPTPSTLTFYATDSATQDHDGNTVYYGDPGDWMLIRKTPTTQGGDGFVKFDLSDLPDDAIITQATFSIHHNSTNNFDLDLGVYHGLNDAWSLLDLDSPIGFDPDDQLGGTIIPTYALNHTHIEFLLDTGSEHFQNDTIDKALTLGLIPEETSNDSVYSYFEGAKAMRVKRPYLILTTTTARLGDYNKDGDVDGQDLVQFTSYYENGLPQADLDPDSEVNGADIQVFANQFGS